VSEPPQPSDIAQTAAAMTGNTRIGNIPPGQDQGNGQTNPAMSTNCFWCNHLAGLTIVGLRWDGR